MSIRSKVCKRGCTWCERCYWGKSNFHGHGATPGEDRLDREARAEELWKTGQKEEAWKTDQLVAALLDSRDKS